MFISLQTLQVQKSDDFEKCIGRFQAKLADLIGVYNDKNTVNTEDTKTIISDLKDILEEIDKLSSYEDKILDFVKNIVAKN